MTPGLGPWQELLAVEGQSLAATEEGDHAPAPLPEEQYRSQSGPLIIAGCSQLGPVTNKTAPRAHSVTDRGVEPIQRRQKSFESTQDQGSCRATHGHNKAAEGTIQGCGSQFFPTNTKRDLLMGAEHGLPRGKEPRD